MLSLELLVHNIIHPIQNGSHLFLIQTSLIGNCLYKLSFIHAGIWHNILLWEIHSIFDNFEAKVDSFSTMVSNEEAVFQVTGKTGELQWFQAETRSLSPQIDLFN